MSLNSLNKVIAETENTVAKGISTSSLQGQTVGSSSTLAVRQDLLADITNLAYRDIPFRNSVQYKKGVGNAFTFDLTDSLFSAGDNSNPREMYYADGGLPTTLTTSYATKTVAFKAVGSAGSVTGLAEAQGQDVVELYTTEVERTTRRVLQALEWLAFWSRTDTNNTLGLPGFPGLDELITTNVVDAQGAAISKALFDSAAMRIYEQGYTGGNMKIFCAPGIAIDVNNLYNNYSQVIINSSGRDNLTLGNIVPEVRTILGVLPIEADFFLNPGNTYPLGGGGSSTPLGSTKSTIFFLPMEYIAVRYLKAIGMEELGRVADKRSFFVNEYSAIELTAEKWCAKIINVAQSVS